MNCLQKLANEKNITIISSIHAPNSETLSLFNQIYVLANGVAVFSGPPSTIRLYLEQQLQITLPTEQPPVEALIQITSSRKFAFLIIKLFLILIYFFRYGHFWNYYFCHFYTNIWVSQIIRKCPFCTSSSSKNEQLPIIFVLFFIFSRFSPIYQHIHIKLSIVFCPNSYSHSQCDFSIISLQ